MSKPGLFDFILDAWAILAHLENERGAGQVLKILDSAGKDKCKIGMSLINLGEVAYIVERERGITHVHEVLSLIQSLPISVLPVDEEIVFAAAHLKANYPISYADAFAAATAQRAGGRLMTGDPELKEFSEIEIEWIG